MKSLFFRQFIVTAGLVLLCVVLLGFTAMGLCRNYLLNERHESLLENADTVASTASAYEVSGSLWVDWYFKVNVSTIASATNSHIFLCNSSGEVVICSDTELYCRHIGKVIDSGYLDTILDDGSLMEDEGLLGGFYEEPRCSVGVPVYNSRSEVVGYAFVTVAVKSMTEVWRNMASIFIVTAVIVLLLALIVTSVTAHYQTRPLNEMAAAAQRFALGEFDARVDPEGRRDELGSFMVTFNDMADSLEKSEQRRSEFVANVSHELKTPITTISGYADGILDGTIPPEKERDYLSIISAEAGRMNRMVRRMLEMSRLQSVDRDALLREKFDLTELIARVLISLESKILEHKLDVDLDMPEEAVFAHGDADSINQVIYNLLDNAIKFSAADTVIELKMWVKAGKCHISVSNHGDTIPPEELKLIFDRFHKTDRSRSLDRDGVGLGLYIVKTIVNNHSEDITVTSENGVTTFEFSLTQAAS